MIRTMVTRKGFALEKMDSGSYYNMNHSLDVKYLSGDISNATLYSTFQSAIANRPSDLFKPVYVEVNYIIHGELPNKEPRRQQRVRSGNRTI